MCVVCVCVRGVCDIIQNCWVGDMGLLWDIPASAASTGIGSWAKIRSYNNILRGNSSLIVAIQCALSIVQTWLC